MGGLLPGTPAAWLQATRLDGLEARAVEDAERPRARVDLDRLPMLVRRRRAPPLTAHDGATPVRFLADLDPDAGAAVRDRLEAVSVAGGRVLFEQGDPPDALYVLVSGALGVSVRDMATGAVRRIARVAPPDTVGEMALLSDVPHSATVTTLRDAHLLRLSREAFADILLGHPTTALYFARLLADRLRASSTTPRQVAPSPTTFAAIAVTDGVVAGEVGRKLATSLGPTSACLDQWPVDADETWFHRLEDRHAAVVYAGDVDDPSWTKLCLRRADHVILLAQAGAPLAAGAERLISPSEWTRTDLIVLQKDDALRPLGAHSSLDRLGAALTTHVRAGAARDVRRAARLASAASIGIVLSGGGARGFAHLGVLRALREAGLEFDLLGGTSIGAVIAAGYALGWGDGELRERIVEAFVSNQPLNDYTLPLVALTRGGKVDARLARHFGDVRIEDLWTPFFCVSSNLTTGTASYHRSGRLSTALRASVAIPGLLPPVLSEEGVLADGAI